MPLREKLRRVLGFPRSRRQSRLARQRVGIDRNHFVLDIHGSGGRRDAAERVWDLLLDFIVDPDLSPYPDDDLSYLYGLGEEELEVDMIADTCRALGLQLPTQSLIDRFGPVNTPRQVVLLISKCPPEA